jgi:hypothetical protein
MKPVLSILKLNALLVLLLVLPACSPYLQAVQTGSRAAIHIRQGTSFGQTFTAAYGGLQAVQFYLEPVQTGPGEVVLRLRSGPHALDDLAVVRMPLEEVGRAGYVSFNFPALSQSQLQDYYAFLEITGEGELGIRTGPAEGYIHGSAYLDHQPEDAQADFLLSYAWAPLLGSLMKNAASWSALTLAGLLLFVLPGWALVRVLLDRRGKLSWGEMLGLGGGTSLAIYPLLMLWTDFAGLRLYSGYAWLPVLAGLAWAAWLVFERIKKKGEPAPENLETARKIPWPSLAYLAVLAVLLLTRFWAVRTLEAPMWGDSVQHTVMTQLMLDQGGLFQSWEPYTPYRSLTVQFGFPAAAAVFAWLTGLTSWQAALYAGQLINVLAAAALYPLAKRLTGSDWSAAAAVLAAGLLTPAPAVYVNWGRYAQLAGQAILPAALWLLWTALERPRTVEKNRPRRIPWAPLSLAAITLAGMTLTYYRMPFYYATFAAALILVWGLPQWRSSLPRWGRAALHLALLGAGAVLLCLPWGLRVMQGSKLAGLVESGVSTRSPWELVAADYQVWLQVGEYIPVWLLALAALGTVWALVRRNWLALLPGLWTAGLASLVALSLLRIPGANMMQNFAVVIALYLPVGLMVGWLFGETLRMVKAGSPGGQMLAAGVIVGAALWGGLGQKNIAQPDTYALATRPDMRAMEWIAQNTPVDSRFLVEGFRLYGYTAVGADAGWWLPLLAGRENTMPPQYALMNEAPQSQDYSRQVVQLVGQIEETGITSTESLDLLCRWGISHVYIGQGQGKVSIESPQLFRPADFENNPQFRPVYRQDRVRIYAVEQDSCEGRNP